MKKSLEFIFNQMLHEKRPLLAGLLMTVGASVATWFGPRAISGIIDEGLVPGNSSAALKWVLILAGVEFARVLFLAGSQLFYAVLGQNVIERVRDLLVRHLLGLPVSYFDRTTSGGMMTRVVNDTSSLTDFFQSGFVSVLGNVASFVAAFVGLYGIHPRIGMVFFLALFPFLFLCTRFSLSLRSVYESTRSRLSELNSMLADHLFGMRTVRALGLGRQSYIKIEKKVDLYAESQEKMVSTFALFHPTVTIGTGVLILLLIGMGIPMLDSGQIKTGQWVAVLSYILLLQQPLIEISDRWNFFISGITGVQRILEVLNSPLEKSEGRLAPEFSSLTLNGVSFRYPDAGSLALSSLSLEINRGDWVGVFGESGSGKTTFLQLLYRFYEPTEGVLLWNQEPIEELDRHSIRSRFGVVEQFPFLYSGSIRENITLFGRFQFDEKELLRTFNGFPLIHSLLSNLDRLVSERGYNLSMGERQMITFLRAWIAKPLIWILDEATAFFDERAEAELLRALDALKPIGVTVIQVAHRPEALKRMNRLFKVQQGEFLELESDFSLQSKDLP